MNHTQEKDISSHFNKVHKESVDSRNKRIGNIILNNSGMNESHNGKQISPDYITVSAMAKKMGRIDPRTIIRKIDELNNGSDGQVITGVRKGEGKHVYYSPKEQQLIYEYMKEFLSEEQIPERYLLIGDIAEKNGVSYGMIKKTIDRLNGSCEYPIIVGERYKTRSGHVGTYYSPKEQQLIHESIEKVKSSMDQKPNHFFRIGEKALRISNKENDLKIAPEDYLTITGIAKEIGVSGYIAKKIIDEFNRSNDNMLVGEEYKSKHGGVVAVFYSPKERQRICELLKDYVSIKQAPEDYLPISAMSQKLNCAKETIKRRINGYNRNIFGDEQIIGEKFRDGSGKFTIYYSPEEQKKIFELMKDFSSIERAPEGYRTLLSLADEMTVGYKTLKKRIKEYNSNPDNIKIIGEKFKDKTGKIVIHYSPEEQKRIRELPENIFPEGRIPEGYLTLGGVAKEAGTKDRTISKRLGLNDEFLSMGSEFKSENGRIFVYYSPKEQRRICELLKKYIPGGQAPDDYCTMNSIARRFGVKERMIKKVIAELNDESDEPLVVGDEFRSKKGQILTYYSPEEQKLIRGSLEEFLSAKSAPENFLTIKGIAKKMEVSDNLIKRIIEEINDDLNESLIVGTSYKGRSGRIETLFSPVQQAIIIERLAQRSSGTSFPENAVAFYLEKTGQNIQQGLRPDWLKNPMTGHNLEVDMFIDLLNVGIEYDGCFYHQDVERDIKKDNLARKNGYRIIHIREDGCPEMPEGSVCINRKNNADDTDLGECIKKCFETIGIPVPDINVARDKKDIMAFMRQRVLDRLDSARTFEELSVAS